MSARNKLLLATMMASIIGDTMPNSEIIYVAKESTIPNDIRIKVEQETIKAAQLKRQKKLKKKNKHI